MKYYNVTQEEIDKKIFNIFVGISLGNKLLTPELAKHYVKWAHDHTKDDALILIADEIDIVNWQVFRNMKKAEAKEKVQQKAYGISGMFEKAKRDLYKSENDPSYITKVHTIFWDDIKNKGFKHLKEILTEEYKTNESFRKQVLFFVEKYVELRDTDVSEKEKDTLASYIISELPTLLGGIFWNKTLYNLILYPTYIESGMSQFVIDIRNGKYFDSSKLQLRQLCVLVEDFLETPKNTNG
ncbi:MAG: tRNA-dependent cyclodipeptide synthase [Candidatus Delongbacteria bacterium]|nr:tRNA-dependent cyclodipeptide synthase [Candidatus Delongbacteria bacterium]